MNAALELAAAVDARKRTELLEEFRDLLNRMNVDLIEHDEIEDHAGGAA